MHEKTNPPNRLPSTHDSTFFSLSPPEAVCRAQSSRLKSYSCSETPQDESGLTTPQDESLTKLCDDVTARIESRIKQQRQSLNEQRFTVWLFTVNMNIYRNYRNYLLQTL